MKRMILLTAMAALVMLQTSCDTQKDPSIFETWSSPGFTIVDVGFAMTSVVITLNSSGTFSLAYQASGPNTQSGTFSPATLPPLTDITFNVLASSGLRVPPPGSAWLLRYSNLTVTTVDVYFDMNSDGFEGPFVLQKM